jgi:chromosome segregation ATPase
MSDDIKREFIKSMLESGASKDQIIDIIKSEYPEVDEKKLSKLIDDVNKEVRNVKIIQQDETSKAVIRKINEIHQAFEMFSLENKELAAEFYSKLEEILKDMEKQIFNLSENSERLTERIINLEKSFQEIKTQNETIITILNRLEEKLEKLNKK